MHETPPASDGVLRGWSVCSCGLWLYAALSLARIVLISAAKPPALGRFPGLFAQPPGFNDST